jgi:hypothetical protein
MGMYVSGRVFVSRSFHVYVWTGVRGILHLEVKEALSS